jgi:hypothetical protein
MDEQCKLALFIAIQNDLKRSRDTLFHFETLYNNNKKNNEELSEENYYLKESIIELRDALYEALNTYIESGKYERLTKLVDKYEGI